MDYSSTISPVRTVIPLSNIKVIEETSTARPSSSPGSVRLYEQAKIREARKRILSTLVPEECTFKPKTNNSTNRRPTSAVVVSSPVPPSGSSAASSSSISSSPHVPEASSSTTDNDPTHATLASPSAAASPRVIASSTRLYDQAKEHAKKLELLKEKAKNQYSFAPTILPRSMALFHQDQQSKVKPGDQLYRKGMEDKKRREQMQDTLIKTSYSFVPHINEKSKKIIHTEPVGDRLSKSEWQTRRRHPELNDHTVSISKQFPFKPTLISRSRSSSPPPAKGKESESTELNDASTSPNKDNTETLNKRYERLFAEAERKRKAREELEQIHIQKELEPCTFKPDVSVSQISGKRIGITAEHDHSSALFPDISSSQTNHVVDENLPAHERLYLIAAERKERHQHLSEIALLEKQQSMESECTFEPAISRMSRKLASVSIGDIGSDSINNNGESTNHASMIGGTVIPRHIQLYEEGLLKLHRKHLAPEHQPYDHPLSTELEECTFQPRINNPRKPNLTNTGDGNENGENDYYQGLSVHERLYEDARNKQIVYSATVLGNVPNNADALQSILDSVSSHAGNYNNNGTSSSSPGKTVSWLELLNRQPSQNNLIRRPISPIKDRLSTTIPFSSYPSSHRKASASPSRSIPENSNAKDDDDAPVIRITTTNGKATIVSPSLMNDTVSS